MPEAVAGVVAQDDLLARTKAPQPTDPHVRPVWAPVVISPGAPRRRRRRGQAGHSGSVRRLTSGKASHLPSVPPRPSVKADSHLRRWLAARSALTAVHRRKAADRRLHSTALVRA